MTNELLVLRGTDVLEQLVLGPQAIEIGSAPECDLRLNDPQVPPRAYLIQERAGTVWLHDLAHPKDPEVLPLDRRVALGPYALVRRYRPDDFRSRERTTLPMIGDLDPVTRWTLVVGQHGEARRIAIGDKPVTVGTGRDCDLVLHDATVSHRHCRFEPGAGHLWVRDLGSTNGTYVQGVRMQRGELTTGMRVRVGRTDIHVLAASSQGESERTLVAASEAMQEVVVDCRNFARLDWPVLVLGPSGVGKEEIAHLLHRTGPRKNRPFVALNAGGLPRELIESELFGHEKGAFTGAFSQRKGAFELAHGGTLFLDEIGELPLDLQARLLRVLETWQIRRVGGERPLSVDVRLICATHCDLARMVHEGTFRQDLYYRLFRLVVRVPPLAERPEDILALADHFLGRIAGDLGRRTLSNEAKTRLLAHPWPGNARELRNVLGMAVAMTPGSCIELGDIELALRRLSGPRVGPDIDGEALARALKLYRGNLSAVARALSVPRSTLRDRLKKRCG